jgi:ribosomal protein S18 acetylase RimI-like enzyme
MIIRRATFADVSWLRLLFSHLVEDQQRHFPDHHYPGYDAEELDNFTLVCARELGNGAPHFLAWLAVDPTMGTAVGFLAGEIASRAIWKPHVFAAPHWLYVAPAARGQGVAQALVAAGVAHLAELGIADVELAALPGDDQWARRGWQPYLVRYAMPTATIASLLVAKAEAARPAMPAVTPASRRAPVRRKRRRRRTVTRRVAAMGTTAAES